MPCRTSEPGGLLIPISSAVLFWPVPEGFGATNAGLGTGLDVGFGVVRAGAGRGGGGVGGSGARRTTTFFVVVFFFAGSLCSFATGRVDGVLEERSSPGSSKDWNRT